MGVGDALEREVALTAVTRLVSQARAGRGGALFVVGEAGLGKTTVLDHARKLACPDIRIGWGCGEAMEASLPCGLFAAVLDTVNGPRNLLGLPETNPAGGAARFGGVLRWLEATATTPVLLVFDDLHWADPDSLALVSFVVRRISRIRRLPVAVLGALRPWPPAAAELATALAHDGYAALERLAPLSREAGAKFLAARLDAPLSAAVVRTALDLCGGNPLLLEQMAVALERGEGVGALTWTGTAASRTEIALTRFAGVGSVALRCAQAASVLGTRFHPELAAVVAQLTDREADIALDALCRAGLVRPETETETETAAQFVHPLFRQALYDDLAVPVRTRLHARAFTALTARGLHGEALDHALRADLTGNDGAIEAMTHAGMTALRSGAPARAMRYLQAAVCAAGEAPSADVLVALAESLLEAGYPGEAIPACYRLRAQQLTSAQRVKTLRILGRAFSATGAHREATTCFAQAGELAEGHGPAVTIEVLLDAAMASWISAGPAKSLPLADRAYTLAANATTSLRNRAASVWGYLAFLSGDPRGLVESEAGAQAAEAEVLTSLSDLYCSWDALSAFSITATFAERFKDAEYFLDMLVSAAERSDTAEMINGLAITQAIVAARQGRLAEALGFTERAGSPAYVFHAGSIRAEILHQMGRSAEAGEWCDRIEPDATAHGESSTLLRLWNIRGQQLLRDGNSAAASELYLRLEELSNRMGIGEPCWIPWARYAIAAHVSAGRLLDARRVIGWLDRSAARLPCRYPRIAVATGRASLAEAAGDYQAAEIHFHSALALHEEVILPLEQVETLLSYGAFLRRRGYPCRARPLLAQAAAIAEANQAGWLYEQVHEEFAVAGGRRRRREEATRLTVQEQRVARLAAAGHSNKAIAAKLILSVKTIEYHLQQIYMKLGISSRRQLMTGQHDGKELLIASAS